MFHLVLVSLMLASAVGMVGKTGRKCTRVCAPKIARYDDGRYDEGRYGEGRYGEGRYGEGRYGHGPNSYIGSYYYQPQYSRPNRKQSYREIGSTQTSRGYTAGSKDYISSAGYGDIPDMIFANYFG